ncbi:phage tail tape measure protein [Staphylococcus equorum]|uniref:phage tail tape measure protein n=1 Tax=Staphylococcus equorum TaxID=246432 RepID=UPI003D806E00
MAERIKGLQIDLSMKDMGIGATLAGVRRSFKTLNSDLKLSRNNFKNSEKSMTSYKNRIRELDGATKQQRNNVKELRAQYQKTAQEQGANSAKAARLRTEYNKQADTLNYLEHELEQTTSSFKNFQKESQAAARVSNSSFGRLGKSFTEMGPKINKVGESMKSVGRSMSMYVTAPVVAGFAGAVKASIDYEQALAGVAKTTDLSGKKLQSMSKEITNMSNTLPFTSTEIAGVAEAAGQLGVKKSEITDFTRTMLDMSVATNLTSEEAATEFARFANAAGMPISDVDRLGSAVVALGNSTATTEKEIVEMGQRLAGAGSQAGFSSNEIMSISAAMSSVGIEAEAGGTAMTQIFNKMTKASAEGGEELNNFAKVSGMSATEFAQTWENNPTKALSAFVKGLGNTEGGAKGVLKALDGVGITGIREADTIRRMSNNHGILNKALKTGEKGWKDNSALSEEAETRYKTLASQLKVLRNNFVNFGRSLGDTFGPTIGWVAEKLSGMFKYLQTANPLLKGSVVIFGALAAAIGPLALVVGVFTASLGSIMTTLGPIMIGITKAGGVMKYLSGVMATVTKASPLLGMALKGIGSAATFMLGPWGLVIAGVVALGAALVVAYKKSETFRNIVNGMVTGVVNGFKLLWSGIMTVLTPIGQAFMKFGGQIKSAIGDFWAKYGAQFMQAINNIKNGFLAFWTFIQPVLGFIGGLFKSTFSDSIPIINFFKNLIMGSLVHAFNIVKNSVMIAFNAIKGIIMGVLNVVMGFVKMFIGIFTGDWKLFGEGLKQVAKSFLSILKNLFQLAFAGILGIAKTIWGVIKNTIVGLAKGIWTGVKNAFTWLKNSTVSIFNSVKTFAINVWNWIKDKVVGFAKSLWSGVQVFWYHLKRGTTIIFSAVRDFLLRIWEKIRNKISHKVKVMWAYIKAIWTVLSRTTKDIFNNVRSFLYDIWNKVRNKVVSIATSLYNGVRNKFNNLKNSIKSIMGKVKNNLYDVWDKIWNKVTGVASSLWSTVRGTFQNMKDGIKGFADKIGGTINGMVGGIKKGLNKLIDGVNWVGGKLGIDKTIPKLSTGTDGASNSVVSNGTISSPTLATVNDRGPGNGSGIGGHQEVIQRANGQMFAPKGRDVTVPLGKGDVVHSGRSVQKAQKAGVLPKFSRGTGKKKKDWDLLNGGIKKHNHGDEVYGDVPWGPSGGGILEDAGKMKDALVGTAKESGKKAVVGTTKKAADTTKAVKETLDDVMSFVGSPGKLVNAMLKKFGVDFGNVKGEIPKDMMWDGMWKGLKNGVKSLFDGWLTAADAGGDGSYIDLSKGINFPFSPHGRAPGYPYAGPHMGVDINYIYDKLYSVLSGKATARSGWNGGFGNMVDIVNGATKVIYGHMSKHAFSGSKQVKPGDELGVSGDSGRSSGPHLHFEVQKNGTPIDPIKWLKKNDGGGKGAGKWKSDIKKAAKATGVSLSGSKLKDIMNLIQTESNGNAKVKQQIQDVNSGSNAARGLLQYTPGTFAGYATKNGKNILNGYHQLKAFFNNSNWSSDLASWKSRMARGSTGWGPTGSRRGYATGGIINSEGMYNLAEDGHSEVVVPLDPARANDAMKLIGYAQSKIKDKKNKRPNDMSNKYSSQSNGGDNTNLLMQMIGELQEQNGYLKEIVRSNKSIEGQPKGFTERDVSQAQGKKAQMMAYNLGGAF